MTIYHESVKRLREKEFQAYADKYGSEPDETIQAKFNDIIDRVSQKRHGTYLEDVQKRYSKPWIEKVMAYGKKLSPLELSRLNTFEELSVEYIKANKDSVTTEEISSFFDSRGKAKAFIPDPMEKEIGELDLDETGEVIEMHQAAPIKQQQEVSYEQAKRMTSDELAKILPQSD